MPESPMPPAALPPTRQARQAAGSPSTVAESGVPVLPLKPRGSTLRATVLLPVLAAGWLHWHIRSAEQNRRLPITPITLAGYRRRDSPASSVSPRRRDRFHSDIPSPVGARSRSSPRSPVRARLRVSYEPRRPGKFGRASPSDLLSETADGR